MIDWKEPSKEIIRLLQREFMSAGQNPKQDYIPSPDSDYLYATEHEIAIALGRDINDLDDDEKEYGPLWYDWSYGPNKDFIKYVCPEELKNNVFPAKLEDGTKIVLADSRITQYNMIK